MVSAITKIVLRISNEILARRIDSGVDRVIVLRQPRWTLHSVSALSDGRKALSSSHTSSGREHASDVLIIEQ